jgi:hypothetical protein
MRDDAISEERSWTIHSSIDDLVRNDNRERREMRLQTTDGANREQMCDAGGFERVDVCLIWELARSVAVARAMTWKENDVGFVKLAK